MIRFSPPRGTMRPLCFAGLALLLVVAGCSNRPFKVEPPDTVRSAYSRGGQTTRGPFEYNPDPRPISICYSSQLNTPEEVVGRARELCPNQGRLQFHSEDALFNGCALFQPYRVTFICTPGPAPPSRYN